MRILLLADQDRLIRLFARPAATAGTEVRAVAEVDAALETLSTWKPDIVLVQGRLGEVSGEMLAHRLAVDLKRRKTRIVLIGDPAGGAAAAGKSPYVAVDASLSDSELAKTIAAIVNSPPSGPGKRRASNKRKSDESVAGTKDGAGPEAPPLPTDAVTDLVEIGGSAPEAATRAGQGDRTTPASGTPPARSRFQERLENALEEPRSSGYRRGNVPPVEAPGPAPIPTPAAGPRRVLIGLLVVAGIILILFLLIRGLAGPGGKGETPVPDRRSPGKTAH